MKGKKLFASGVAALMAATMIGETVGMQTVSADTLLGDVNGDGSISLADSVALSKFVNGVGVLSDYTVADLNSNYVIDGVDVDILIAFVMGMISSIPYTG